MKHLLLFAGIYLCILPIIAQEIKPEILPKEIQIKTATLPAPSGELVVLREGTNNLVCIGDDISKEGISVSCYSKKLEPFMARGRELSAEGKDFNEKREIRGAEVASGKIPMPKEPSMTYIYYGKEENYDKSTGELKDGQFRYVISHKLLMLNDKSAKHDNCQTFALYKFVLLLNYEITNAIFY